MVKQKTSGEIGGIDIELTLEGGDEALANLLYADLVGRLGELNEIVEVGKPPDAAQGPMSADWEGYLNGEYE